MLRAPAFKFYMCAKYMTAMADLADGTPMRSNHTAIKIFGRAEGICESITIDEFWLHYLPSSVKRAKKIIDLIKQDIFMGEDKVCETLSATHMEWIRNGVHAFEISLCDEIGNMPLFCCEDSKLGNLSIDKLLNGASNGYPERTRTKLTPECLAEIDEAGKCLAYERSTASGFHILRSVELAIRQYLLAIQGFVMPPLNRQNWGEYLDLLKGHGASREVTDHLYNIKDNYRNPLMHPQDTLDMDEAVSLFGVAQSMSEMLVVDMTTRGLIT
jgi:hypothetical protein